MKGENEIKSANHSRLMIDAESKRQDAKQQVDTARQECRDLALQASTAEEQVTRITAYNEHLVSVIQDMDQRQCEVITESNNVKHHLDEVLVFHGREREAWDGFYQKQIADLNSEVTAVAKTLMTSAKERDDLWNERVNLLKIIETKSPSTKT